MMPRRGWLSLTCETLTSEWQAAKTCCKTAAQFQEPVSLVWVTQFEALLTLLCAGLWSLTPVTSFASENPGSPCVNRERYTETPESGAVHLEEQVCGCGEGQIFVESYLGHCTWACRLCPGSLAVMEDIPFFCSILLFPHSSANFSYLSVLLWSLIQSYPSEK